MSLLRAVLSSLQAVANHLACTPPNPTTAKQRYHTEEWWVLQIAPLVFKIHLGLLWTCAFFESLLYASTFFPSPLPPPLSYILSPSSVRTTPLFLIGSLSIFLGTYIRLDCFRALGELFTFDLTVHPQHRLITKRFYAYVRHPAYTGSLLLVAGIAFAHLSEGGWLTECGPLRLPGSALIVWIFWWAWTLSVGVSRAIAEDKQMRKLFQDEWDRYAVDVPWWFFPGIL
ncbi:hypothetical protein AX15_005616 [Amanita polypyramis BW_CC]|nr:hypothetical protein AX15_005616 [Amanita polypyramis BW_CC]